MGRRNVYRIFVGKLEGMRPIGSPRREWIRWNGMDWIDLAQDRGQWQALVNTVINLQLP
jgi:hypothetical protein